MILIGKTCDCLLGAHIIAHSTVLKAVDEFVRMREITWSVKDTLNVLLQLFSSTSIYRSGLEKLSI